MIDLLLQAWRHAKGAETKTRKVFIIIGTPNLAAYRLLFPIEIEQRQQDVVESARTIPHTSFLTHPRPASRPCHFLAVEPNLFESPFPHLAKGDNNKYFKGVRPRCQGQISHRVDKGEAEEGRGSW